MLFDKAIGYISYLNNKSMFTEAEIYFENLTRSH